MTSALRRRRHGARHRSEASLDACAGLPSRLAWMVDRVVAGWEASSMRLRSPAARWRAPAEDSRHKPDDSSLACGSLRAPAEDSRRLRVPRRRGLPRPPSGLARFRVRSGASGVWRVAIFVLDWLAEPHIPRTVRNRSSSALPSRDAPSCFGASRSRSGYGSALYDSGPNDDRQHDRVIVSLDLRRWLEAPGSGKASPPVPAPTGSLSHSALLGASFAGERGTSDSPAPDVEYEFTLRPSRMGDQARNSACSRRETRTPRPRAATRQKRSSGTANGAASSSVGNHAVRKRSPYAP